MQFHNLDRFYTGVLVPVSALRSEMSCGIGEFADLPLLGQWCSSVGLEIIQILPVNDTGLQTSPYSALSAFALHPIYIRLQDIPELDRCQQTLRERIETFRTQAEIAPRVQFQMVLSQKLDILWHIFGHCQDEIMTGGELSAWIDANVWVRQYAAFRYLKEKNLQEPWTAWKEMRDPASADIDGLWTDYSAAPLLNFYAWVQMRLEQQLIRASRELSNVGVWLKGDLPILMDIDSADVWAHRTLFSLGLRAGAPPDMFSELGQNWGFPVYDWDALGKDDYRWWKERLLQANKYYYAYRIDHVLGFFRIWAIPADDTSGILGYFFPASDTTTEQLAEAGFDEGRIRWLAEPHIDRARIDELFGHDSDNLVSYCFEQIGEENLYLFSERITGERAIEALGLDEKTQGQLLSIFRDRTLIRTTDGSYAVSWNYRDCSRYKSLFPEEKERFETIVQENKVLSEELWEERGRSLLSFMNSTTPMLTCAEDLGVIPDSVPRVLERLGILGLRIPRWSRQWLEEGQHFIPLDEYPYLTVCALSVHDTTTMREWWDHDPGRKQFWESIGLAGECPPSYDVETASAVTCAVLETTSAICMLQIQDLFALEEQLRENNPADERINVPGTYNSFNWTYRIRVTLETLQSYDAWNNSLRKIVAARRRRHRV